MTPAVVGIPKRETSDTKEFDELWNSIKANALEVFVGEQAEKASKLVNKAKDRSIEWSMFRGSE